MIEKTTLNNPTDPAYFLPHVTGCADNKPKLLDLYCGGGGASYGYELAGWNVVGVDIDPQPKYRGKFIQADAFEYLKAHYTEFDAVHASPPYQKYSKAAMQFRIAGKEYPDLIEQTRELLKMTGLPYIIENVPDASLKTKILIMKNKTNYQETGIITDVTESEDWYQLSRDGMCCGLKKKYGVKPKVGDKLTVQTKGSSFGIIRGMDLNGKKIFWKTDEDLETERTEWLRNNEDKKQQKFKDNVVKMDKQYDNLPDFFKKRIDKFRTKNERFRIDDESYEMFCCEQAVLIAKSCKNKEEVQAFKSKEWEEQIKQVEGLSDGHSGNTFGCSCRLAYLYLDNPENVVKVYGALSPLVGSEKYGD